MDEFSGIEITRVNFRLSSPAFLIKTQLEPQQQQRSQKKAKKESKMTKSTIELIDVTANTIMTTFGIAILATIMGYGVVAISTWMVLYITVYMMAPRRTFPTAEAVCPDTVAKKIVIVTGATSGIGVDTAGVLYQKGATVYIAARNPSKLEETKDLILKKYNSKTKGTIHTLICDLSDLDSVKQCAEVFLKSEHQLDILINNAGIMALPQRVPTKQGLESQVGVCHVGHFYLTQLLLSTIRKSHGRVVCVSSSAHQGHQMKRMLATTTPQPLETVPYDSWVAYGNAKCCNILFAQGLHRRCGIVAVSLMPGGIHTALQAHVPFWTMLKWIIVTPLFFKSTAQGAATSILCATSPDVVEHSGQYFEDCKVTDAWSKVETQVGPDAVEELWTQTESVIKKLGY
jgi:NAD(P)-dependent dehydrogenase (short-subunit alcohol dehydrogenase family)